LKACSESHLPPYLPPSLPPSLLQVLGNLQSLREQVERKHPGADRRQLHVTVGESGVQGGTEGGMEDGAEGGEWKPLRSLLLTVLCERGWSLFPLPSRLPMPSSPPLPLPSHLPLPPSPPPQSDQCVDHDSRDHSDKRLDALLSLRLAGLNDGRGQSRNHPVSGYAGREGGREGGTDGRTDGRTEGGRKGGRKSMGEFDAKRKQLGQYELVAD